MAYVKAAIAQTDGGIMITVRQFNAELDKTRHCDGCPMYGKGVFVGMDTSTGAVGISALMLMGLNPGSEEAREGLPFVGPSGRFLRAQLEKASIKAWGMANSLLCSSANESAIVQADLARAICRANVGVIFHALQPCIIAPCGNGAWSIFKTRIPITGAARHFFVSRGPSGKSRPVIVAPMLHPSALIRSGGANSRQYPEYFERLQEIGQLTAIAGHAGVEDALKWLEENGKIVQKCFQDSQK